MPQPCVLSSTTLRARGCDLIRLPCASGGDRLPEGVGSWQFDRMNPSICRTLSTICFQAGILSIVLSIWIWWFVNGDAPEEQAHAERFGIFIGLWAPTLLILSNRFDRYADKAKTLPGLAHDDKTESA